MMNFFIINIRCHHGFWTDYGLTCTATDCGKITETETLSVVYLSNGTRFESRAEVTVTCSQDDLSIKETLTCKEVGKR